MKKQLTLFVPLLVFLLIAVFLLKGLFSDPYYRDSSQIGKPFPSFKLNDLMDAGSQIDESIFNGQVTLLNVWGTWCLTCKYEIPYLTSLRENGVQIIGLYIEQDTDPDFALKPLALIQQEVTEMLSQFGNPYQLNIFDEVRTTSFDLGVTGAPETFLIDRQGIIRLHHIGDMNERVWRAKFAALYSELNNNELASNVQ